MKKQVVSIITLGCKVNQYESNAIARELEEKGFEIIHELGMADIYIVNTCAVTNEGEKKSRGIIAKIKKLNNTAPIYICGCSSQNDPSKFEKHENVKAIYGTSSKQNLVKHILEDRANNLQTKPIINQTISDIYEEQHLSKGDRTRVVMKIQEGCNNYCSYCLIPYVRGRERSRSLDAIKKEIEFHKTYAKEIIFTGINLSHYGFDFHNGTSLINIALLMRYYPNIRFRFSSLEQDVITEEFLNVIKDTPNFAPHFHLSLQSGCDKTLKFMNRKYTSKEYYKKLEMIREVFDNPAITTDIIVGFPTETEEDFEACYNFAKKCKFAKIHIFPYSLRSGTVASKLKNVATDVKERVRKLSELDKQMQQDYTFSCINKTYDAIIEKEHNDYFEAHTENYIKCYIKTDKLLKQNSVVKVKICKIYKDGAEAEIV